VDVECFLEPEEDTGEEEAVGAGFLDGKADAIFEATCFGTGAAAGAADLATSVALGVGTGLVVDFGAGAAGADVFSFEPELLF